jgi:L-fucose isomerase-like protein
MFLLHYRTTGCPMTDRDVVLVASGDSRPAANQICWPAQAALEADVGRVFAHHGARIVRGYPVDTERGHGFIDGQSRGIEIFRHIDPDAPLVVAEAVWQYSSHVLPGLCRHRGPILTLANWSGQWPGLVGMLNLNGSLTKAGVRYSTIWSEDFTDPFARDAIGEWLRTGNIVHAMPQVEPFNAAPIARDLAPDAARGTELGVDLRRNQALLGVFDEGCMGMFNAIIPDLLLHRIGLFKERLSQSALYAAMQQVPEQRARAHYDWLLQRKVRFVLGHDDATELTQGQVLEGLKMYDAAVRLAHSFGCAAIGIQYQQGLKDTCVASDLTEGLLNNPDRPPVTGDDGTALFEGEAVPHFNEVDECAGVDALITNRVWRDLGLDPSNTLHDIRWGAHVTERGVDEFVWVFEISGAAPASHFIGGYAGAVGERQPPMFFPHGGSTLKGVSRPGEIVWSRIHVEPGGAGLSMDIGRGGVVELSAQETNRRWQATTPQWPIMHAVLYGVNRDQLMARHQANHIQVVYAPDADTARRALVRKAAMSQAMGITVHLVGDLADSLERHQAAARG